MADCLDGIIGLAFKAPCCFTDKKPENFDVSTSGYFVLDPEFGVPELKDCQMQGWGILSRSLETAKKDFRVDLAKELLNEYKAALSPFSGVLGQLKFAGTTTPHSDYVGINMRPFRKRGVKFVMTKIFQGLNTSGEYIFRVTSNDPFFVPPTPFSADLVANTFSPVTLVAPIELPAYSRYVDEVEYYISVEVDGAKPLYNIFSCCGVKHGWMEHMDLSAFESDQLDGENMNLVSGASGMVIEGYLTCDTLGWICNLSLNGEFDMVAVLARTLQFRAAALAIGEMVEQSHLNTCILNSLESLQSRRTWLNKRFAENIMWIAQNLPSGITDCYTCKDEDVFHYTTLKS